MAGPSGVGKGSVIACARENHPEIWLSVSATTRLPRPGERDGESYFFLTREQFERRIEAHQMLEWAEYSGNLYGTPRGAVLAHLAEGRHVLLEIEVQGARQIKRAMPEALLVLLKPPSWEELERRLLGRATEDPGELAMRLATAREELGAEPEFDAVIVNDHLGVAAAQLLSLME